MNSETKNTNQLAHSQAENDLLVELCRYYAQVLYAVRDGLDSLIPNLPKVKLPLSGNIPAQSVLLDGVVKPYRYAAGTLLQCGFATEQEHLSGKYVLNVSSDNFVLRAGPGLDLQFGSYPASAFLVVFSIYELNGYLGHPDTLRRVFSLFLQAGLTEARFGYVEWSQRALDLANRRRAFNTHSLAHRSLWATDTFDFYIEEAEAQWLQPHKT
tara:strand:+ start:155 stop:790 length:636 start_codon:yes stop_codon:yes gene_type:complete